MNMARLCALTLCSFLGPPALLLHGGKMAIFQGSMGRLKGSGWSELRDKRCQVIAFNAKEQMWALRLRDSKTHDRIVLADAHCENLGFLVDYCLLPEAGEGEAELSVRTTNTALAGKALEATRDIPRGTVILQELPFLVSCHGNDVSGSRARAFLHVLAEAKEGREDALRALQAFEELTTGGLENECMHDAKNLVASGTMSRLAATQLAQVLARWRSNCQRLSVPPASGLYRVHARLQHSCKPNCAVGVLFSTGEVLVRALEHIPQGELLTRNYEREPFLDLPLKQRQEHLLQTRGFHCLCQRCGREGSSQSVEYGGRGTVDFDKKVAFAVASCSSGERQLVALRISQGWGDSKPLRRAILPGAGAAVLAASGIPQME